jgi:hypothetical protein
VGWNLIPSLANVHLDHSLGVDREPLVGVDNNTEKARVGVDELGLKTDLQVVEYRGIIEVGQVSHVLTFLKLGRVDLANLSRWEHFFLKESIETILIIQLSIKYFIQFYVDIYHEFFHNWYINNNQECKIKVV